MAYRLAGPASEPWLHPLARIFPLCRCSESYTRRDFRSRCAFPSKSQHYYMLYPIASVMHRESYVNHNPVRSTPNLAPHSSSVKLLLETPEIYADLLSMIPCLDLVARHRPADPSPQLLLRAW